MWPQSSPRPSPVVEKLLRAALAAFVVALALGCPTHGGGAGDAREWSWLVATKRGLDADRDRLAAQTPALPFAPPVAAGGRTAEREQDMARRVTAYQRRLQRYLWRHLPPPGEPFSPRARAVLHMRSDEEVRAATDFIVRAGDYRRAIEICEAALAFDPGYPPLERQLAAAKADRYVSAESFAKIKPGMTPVQVLALLGHPNLHDMREYPQRGLVAWFYPRDAAGDVAAVWFRKTAGGLGPVFQVDGEAVAPRRDTPPSADPSAPGHPAV